MKDNRISRRAVLAGTAAAGALSLTGMPARAEVNWKKYAGTKLSILMTGDENDHRALGDLLPQLEEETGIKLEITSPALGALIGHFLAGVPAQGPRFEQPSFRALTLHAWPLNVRELEKIVTTAAVLTGGKPIALRDLPEPIARVLSAPVAAGIRRSTGPSPTPAQLEELLRRYEGNVADVSRELGKHRAAVWRWIKKFGLGPQKFRRGADE